MSISEQRNILVYAHWEGLQSPSLMGKLMVSQLRGKQTFSFNYEKSWLASLHAQLIDPDLQLYPGPQYVRGEKTNFGIFLDSSPDRWGRLLMLRREAILARTESRTPNTLFELDYLLGVYDKHRMGAIRFKESENGQFLNNNQELAIPPWSSLRDLEYASFQVEKDDTIDNPEYLKWLNMLMAPGSSLGGARPKAGVLDTKNNLWIAKFPSANDNKDVGAWEMVVNDLAKDAGLNIAAAMVQKFSPKYHTYLTKRFDRTPTGERIHFASAMTLLGYADGTDAQEGVSYLELAEFLMKHGAMVDQDLEELWRRIVFSICVSNTDDHLRNHGFLLTGNGWILSPAYDINPVETGTGLKLNISEDDNSLNLDLAMHVAPFFRLTHKRAVQIIEAVRKSVQNWRAKAEKYNIPKSQQEIMAKAFLIVRG